MAIVHEVGGVKFTDVGFDRAVVDEIFVEDVYRFEQYVPFDGRVIDLGANIGAFTLRCAVQRSCAVYAVEPGAEAFSGLHANCVVNRIPRSLYVRAAIGAQRALRPIYVNPKCPACSGFDNKNVAGCEERPVETYPLSWVFGELSVVDVLKVDIEGTEREIFVGDNYHLFDKCRVILLEWHNYDGHVYRDILQRLGFEVELAGCGLPQPAYDPTFGRGMLYARKK